VAPLLQNRGFLPQGEDSSTATARIGFSGVRLLDGRRVRFREPGVRLDLGGIAKGFAVDRAVAVLQRAGVLSGLVNAGGDLRAFGDETFTIAIRHPENPAATLSQVALHGASLATSAHTFADRISPGETIGPIFHPRSHQLAHTVRSATVCAESAMTADALTKIVMLEGARALPVLEHFGADAIFVAENGEAMCSPGFHAAFELSS